MPSFATASATGIVYHLTTDLERASDARDRAVPFGLHLQTLFPRDGLPKEGAALIVSLDDLLLDAHGRRDYLAWLQTQSLPMPTVVVSRDFYLGLPTVVRPGLMLAATLTDDVLRALRDGHLDQPQAA
jgi:hypothetical protein